MVGWIGLGALAFGLFLIYDINEVRWQDRWLHKLFFTGFGLLVLATVGLLLAQVRQGLPPLAQRAAGVVLTAVFMALLVYTLFRALPFEATYQEIGGKDKPLVCQSGVYALCRHPGVLWFAGFYGSLWLTLGGEALAWAAVIFSLLNVLYVVFQDRWTFPQMFADYASYQQAVPFLIPNWQSIRRCFATLPRK